MSLKSEKYRTQWHFFVKNNEAYQGSNAKIKFNSSSKKSYSTSIKIPIKTMMEKIKNVVTDKREVTNRDEPIIFECSGVFGLTAF